jgi:hypothetical protein
MGRHLMGAEDQICQHARGKIISYDPWTELCYECGNLLVGDPHLIQFGGTREVVPVQPELRELLMRPGIHAGVR